MTNRRYKCILLILTALALSLASPMNTASAHSKDIIKSNIFEKKIQESRYVIKVSSAHLKHDHSASTLLISCVDFRLRDETALLLNKVLGLMDDAKTRTKCN